MAYDGVRLPDFPDLGAITDDTRLVVAGSGAHGMAALLAYLRAKGVGQGGGTTTPPPPAPAPAGDAIWAPGVVGDGQVDDGPAINAALRTGRNVHIRPGSVCRIGETLVLTADRQWLFAYGVRFVPVGNFDLFWTSGNQGTGIAGPWIEAGGMSGGHVFVVGQGGVPRTGRITVRDVVCFSPWRLGLVVRCNVVAFENVWCGGIRGDYGIQAYGDDATGRADIVRLSGVAMSGTSTNKPIAVLMDGAVNTLSMQCVYAVLAQGLRVRNTASTQLQPYFVMADDFEVDYPPHHAVSLEAGSDFYFSPLLYLHGSESGSGVHVAAAIPHDTVTIGGGKITGHARYGVEHNNRRVRVGVAPRTSNNALGDWSHPGAAVHSAPRYEVDPLAYFTAAGGNPLLAFDANDYMAYDRAANALRLIIGGAGVATWDGSKAGFGLPVVFPGYAAAALPAAASLPGATVRVTDRGQQLATSNGANWLIAGVVVA